MISAFSITALFAGFLAFCHFAGKLSPLVPALYLVASVLTFAVYALDKSAAQADRWRTRESTLHALALMGGWPGALFAQELLRHKSRKRSFQRVFWLTVLINCSAAVSFLVL